MAVQDYYYKKFLTWQQQGDGDYREYFKRLGVSQGEKIERLASEFRGDWNNGFSDVCQYLQQFAKGEEQEPITSIIQGITNPEQDIMEILIGATLDACGQPNSGNALIGLAIVGLIGAALIAYVILKMIQDLLSCHTGIPDIIRSVRHGINLPFSASVKGNLSIKI